MLNQMMMALLKEHNHGYMIEILQTSRDNEEELVNKMQ